MATEALTFSSSIEIDAKPDEVYALVTDVSRTGEWSPICKEAWWDEGAGPEVGAHFTGRNVTPDRTWETRSQVIAAEPGREFAWSVGPGLVRWSYELTPTDAGTELRETWEFGAEGQAFFAQHFGDDAQKEIDVRHKAATEGIPATLAAIKKVAEG